MKVFCCWALVSVLIIEASCYPTFLNVTESDGNEYHQALGKREYPCMASGEMCHRWPCCPPLKCNTESRGSYCGPPGCVRSRKYCDDKPIGCCPGLECRLFEHGLRGCLAPNLFY